MRLIAEQLRWIFISITSFTFKRQRSQNVELPLFHKLVYKSWSIKKKGNSSICLYYQSNGYLGGYICVCSFQWVNASFTWHSVCSCISVLYQLSGIMHILKWNNCFLFQPNILIHFILYHFIKGCLHVTYTASSTDVLG